ncbi:hypothetical protein ACGF3G_15345 [Streptomyces sp. NPDC048179]|uniref:hypothetical protein n=1 Tax=Streptomyces sp. NPDC048179 TaxID=3365506 RepID=UPI0037184AC0
MGDADGVQTGQQSPGTAVRRDLAVGPPSIERIYYGLSLGPGVGPYGLRATAPYPGITPPGSGCQWWTTGTPGSTRSRPS